MKKDAGFWIEEALAASVRPKKLYSFYVTGKGIFPLGMLQLASAWPAAPADVVLLDSVGYKHNRKIKLLSYQMPDRQRWLSAGWPCTSHEIEQEQAT